MYALVIPTTPLLFTKYIESNIKDADAIISDKIKIVVFDFATILKARIQDAILKKSPIS